MSQQQYSGLDRFLHKLVLGSKVIQSTSFELQQLIAPKLPKPDRPVFVVGMARSGTTTLLNLLFATGEFPVSCLLAESPQRVSPKPVADPTSS